MITSDKCYENVGKLTRYKEDDVLGGIDPYSASKSSSELIIRAYRESFFKDKSYAMQPRRRCLRLWIDLPLLSKNHVGKFACNLIFFFQKTRTKLKEFDKRYFITFIRKREKNR